MRHLIIDTHKGFVGHLTIIALPDEEALNLFREVFEEGIRAGQENVDEEKVWKELIKQL